MTGGLFVLALLLFPIVASGQQTPAMAAFERENGGEAAVDFERRFITVAGYGRAKVSAETSEARALILAMTAARANAYNRMAIALGRIRVDGETEIADLMSHHWFRIQFDQWVRFAREIDTARAAQKDGSVLFKSVLGLILVGENGLTNYLIPALKEKAEQQTPARFPLSQNDKPPADENFDPAQSFTGLIIDASHLDVAPAFAPRLITANGRELYGISSVDANSAVANGVAGYSRSPTLSRELRERPGERPVFIKAVATAGKNQADIVIANSDAEKILYADQRRGFLKEARVVILFNSKLPEPAVSAPRRNDFLWLKSDTQLLQRRRVNANPKLLEVAAESHIDWEKDVLLVTAYGASPQINADLNEAKISAQIHATVMAAETICGLHVFTQNAFGNAAPDSGVIIQQINSFLRGAAPVEDSDKFERMSDGSWLAQQTIRVPLRGQHSLYAGQFGARFLEENLAGPAPSAQSPRSSIKKADRATARFTGLLLDCRNLRPRPSPNLIGFVIVTAEKLIYSSRHLPGEIKSRRGFMRYVRSIDSPIAREMIGERPLIIQPLRWLPNNALLISAPDAERLLAADARAEFLQQGRVAILF